MNKLKAVIREANVIRNIREIRRIEREIRILADYISSIYGDETETQQK